jgi:tRNA wybutosine-synthesizing protein 2
MPCIPSTAHCPPRPPSHRAVQQRLGTTVYVTVQISSMEAQSPLAGSKPPSPIEIAVRSWLQILPQDLLNGADSYVENLLSRAPKRWVVYSPMVLLPSGSFGEEWWRAVGSEQAVSRYAIDLWTLLLQSIGKREGKGPLTHLAVNTGIPSHKAPSQGLGSHQGLCMLANDQASRCTHTTSQDGADQNPNFDPETLVRSTKNVLRTPSGLIMLHGDFGPALAPETVPAEKDFEEAFWVSTKQNGITQVWAPRYTMFSRGNIKEKSRLLGFHSSLQSLQSRRLAKEKVASNSAVDLYAGIGYFVFSYVKMGLRKVVGWELNPWSVEGLRRGAVANGWSVKIVRNPEVLDLGEDEQIVVVLEDNRYAAERLRKPCRYKLGGILHVNCGLLPSSEDSWGTALEILDDDGWLHLHENVGVSDIRGRTVEIEQLIMCRLKKAGDQRSVNVEHVEYVKTFAPGVWHCVFDVYISRQETNHNP